jgi:perosamine synthetase
MTNIQAALGVAQMKRIESVIERKRRNAAIYNSLLKELPGLVLPQEAPWARHVYWLYTILIEDRFKSSRTSVIKDLAAQGIETRPVFYPITSMPPYRNGGRQRFAVAEKISKEGLSLPSSPLLQEDCIRRICAVFASAS